MSTLSASWLRIGRALGIAVIGPLFVRLSSGRYLAVDALLPDFGGPCGMLLFASMDGLSLRDMDDLWDLGYGSSVLSRPAASKVIRDAGALAVAIEVLSDWTWSGAPGARPAWLPSVDASDDEAASADEAVDSREPAGRAPKDTNANTIVIDLANPEPLDEGFQPGTDESIVSALEHKGVSGIRLDGMDRIGATSTKGEVLHSYMFPVDLDAYVMTSFYAELEQAIRSGAGGRVRAYLVDGIYEVAAWVSARDVRSLAGFDIVTGDSAPPGSVEMPVEDYLRIWQTVARRLVRASVETHVELA